LTLNDSKLNSCS